MANTRTMQDYVKRKMAWEKIFRFQLVSISELEDLIENWDSLRTDMCDWEQRMSSVRSEQAQHTIKNDLLDQAKKFFAVFMAKDLPGRPGLIEAVCRRCRRLRDCNALPPGFKSWLTFELCLSELQTNFMAANKNISDKRECENFKRLEREAINYANHQMKAEPLFSQFHKEVIAPLQAERDRIILINHDDNRLPVIRSTLSLIEFELLNTLQNYKETYSKTGRPASAEENSRIKKVCYDNILSIVEQYHQHPFISSHRIPGTVIGRTLANIGLAISLVPIVRSHSVFFSLQPESQNTAEKIRSSVMGIRVSA